MGRPTDPADARLIHVEQPPLETPVHPSQRGRGLGRALLEFAEDEARSAGFDAIYLYTHEKMTENIALYSRIGYRNTTAALKMGFPH